MSDLTTCLLSKVLVEENLMMCIAEFVFPLFSITTQFNNSCSILTCIHHHVIVVMVTDSGYPPMMGPMGYGYPYFAGMPYPPYWVSGLYYYSVDLNLRFSMQVVLMASLKAIYI